LHEVALFRPELSDKIENALSHYRWCTFASNTLPLRTVYFELGKPIA